MLALAAFRAPYRGRSTPVNAWWGTFDLAVTMFSGQSADPPSDGFITRNSEDAEKVTVGWWPGDARHPQAAFYAYAYPAPPGFAEGTLSPDGFITRNSEDAEKVTVGWWPGDARHPQAAFYAYAYPAPPGFAEGTLS